MFLTLNIEKHRLDRSLKDTINMASGNESGKTVTIGFSMDWVNRVNKVLTMHYIGLTTITKRTDSACLSKQNLFRLFSDKSHNVTD